MDKALVTSLEEIGFKHKEALVYVALTSVGESQVSELAILTKLKRPIIYVILEDLIKRGFVSKLPGKKVNTYHAFDADIILKKLKSSITHFDELIPVFKTLRNRGGVRPKISYIETKEGIENLLEEINYTVSPLFISSYARFEHHFPGVLMRWIKNYKKGLYKKLVGRHIVPDDKKEFFYAKAFLGIKQNVRTLSILKENKMDISIYADKISITNLGDALFAVVIESKDLVGSIRPIFELAWQNAKEIK
ncbi:MAG: transcriptional regulator [Candidatus Nomurabacteria bacterium]|nr:transcriptional regulator [Candidatus Nomurabacteria bacterium]